MRIFQKVKVCVWGGVLYLYKTTNTYLRYSMLPAVNPLLTICQKYPAALKAKSVNAPQMADSTINPIVAQMNLLYTLPYMKYSAPMTIKFVMFLRTVDMGTPRSFKAQKEVINMPTKMRLTGYQTLTIFQLNGSTLIMPTVLKIWTRTTHKAHWKKSNVSGALKLKLDKAALFSSVCNGAGCRSAVRW